MIKILGIGFIGFLLFAIQKRVYEKLWQRSLYVSVSFGNEPIFEGDQGELKEIIENRKLVKM